jgi:uncharacterized protein
MITHEDELRRNYPPVLERARLKTLPKLDAHCRRFIELSPFLCLGTTGEAGGDVSPRGDAPGFVRVLDDETLAIPDWPGNNRLDSLSNLVANPAVGLLFLVPGVQESLRVNGRCTITTAPEMLALWSVNGNPPRAALVVTVKEAFMHCGKALIRSKLWTGEYQVERNTLASYGQMLKDQIESCDTVVADSAEQIQSAVEEAYRTKLY